MQLFKSFSALTAIWVLVAIAGCSRSEPVKEISIQSSGISVRNQERVLVESDWPGWRGPGNDGVAVDQPIVTQWDAESNILWSNEVPGRGHSSPVVVGDSVFLTTALEDQQKQLVLAYDRHTGDRKWETLVHEGGFPGSSQMHAKGSHANGTVACDGKLVFAAFLHADRIVVSALDRSGGIVWQTEAGPFRSRFGYAPSPILYRSCVIVAADHFGGGFLAALDRDTGKLVWRTQRPSIPTYSSPFIARVAGRDQLLISGCDEVASYDPNTGEANWSCPGTTQLTCGTMVANETSVFASGGHPGRETLCVRADGSGEVLWRNNTRLYEPSMLVFGGHLFAVTDDGIAYCWAVETGDVQWRQRLGGKFSASPVLCNGLLLVSNLSGETFVFQAAGDAYHQIAKNKLGDDYYASFGLSEGLIFARAGFREGDGRQERLFCIGEQDK